LGHGEANTGARSCYQRSLVIELEIHDALDATRRAMTLKHQVKVNFTDSVQWCSSISVLHCCV
jgi:hypothetical protein